MLVVEEAAIEKEIYSLMNEYIDDR